MYLIQASTSFAYIWAAYSNIRSQDRKSPIPIRNSSSSSSSALQPWVGLGLHLRFRNSIFFFTGWGCYPHAQPPTWRARVSLFVWVITLDLSGMGGPTSSIRYYQHSSRDHMTTQAPPLCQSRDIFGGPNQELEMFILNLRLKITLFAYSFYTLEGEVSTVSSASVVLLIRGSYTIQFCML